MTDAFTDRYADAVSRLRREAEAKKSPADKLRERLAYAKRLRAKADSLDSFVDALNIRLQHGHGDVVIQWRPFRRAWAIVFGRHNITLTEAQMEQIFTWAFQAEKDLRANADRIETELAGEVTHD